MTPANGDTLDLTTLLRQAVDASGEVVFMTGRDGVFTFVNRQFERLYGYQADDVVGLATPRILKGGAVRPDDYAAMWQQLIRGEAVQHTFLNRTRDGRFVDIEATVSPIWNDANEIAGFLAIQRDVTAARQAEAQRLFQQTVLATEHELTLDGILTVDERGHVLSFNRRFAQMWDLSDSMIGTRADRALLHAVIDKVSNKERFMERVRQLYAHPDEVSRDEIELTDGRVFDRYSAPMRGADGVYYGRVWYFRDVSESKRAEATLRRERDRAQQYLDVADVILMALDLDGRITLINRTGCSILGWEEHELIGRHWIETCSPETQWDARTRTLRQLQAGDVSPFEDRVVTKSGEERLIAWSHTILRDQAGEMIGTLSSGTDITARSQAVEALRLAEEWMRFALQNAGVGIWDMDYRTGVLRWSEILEAHYGLQPGTFAGTFEAFMASVHPDDRAELLDTVRKAMRSGADFTFENRAVWPDGSERWLHGAGRIHLGEHGEPIRGVGISRDVTPQKKLELELRQVHKLEAVGRLAAGVAHEINTPIQFVSDSVNFVQDAVKDLGRAVAEFRAVNELVLAGLPARPAAEAARTADQEADLDYVLANVPAALRRSIDGLNRVAVIVRAMKEFGHPDLTEKSAVDLNRALESTLIIARNEYKYVADVDTEFGDLPLVLGHGGALNQAFLNIIVNAAHAIGDRFKGTAVKGRIAIRTRFDGHAAEVRISDNGGGIPPAIQHRVFDPFFTTKDVGKGTGQGLAIARSVVVEKHGGDLTFETEAGQGTTFIVRLPIDDRASGGVAAA
jgi:two-component system, NtrC family, sensor kinase